MPKQKVKEIDLGYHPREWQSEAHQDRKRYSIWVLHRRAGKTTALVMEAIQKILTCPLPAPRVGLVYPLREQAKRVAWTMLKEFTTKIPGVVVKESELQIYFSHNKGTISLHGTHQGQYESLRGIYLDLCAYDEYSHCDQRSWTEVVRPALADRKGELIVCGTPQARDHFYDLWMQAGTLPDLWSRYILKASESNIIDDNELAEARALMEPDIYEREFECAFSAMPAGAFYSNEIRELRESGRVTSVPMVSGKPVIAAMDIGVRDQSVVWFAQIIGTSINILNILVWRDTSLRDVIRDIREQPYNLNFLGVPHDAGHRDQLSNTPKVDAIRDLIPGVFVQVLPRLPVTDGVFLVRKLFSQMQFDEANCSDGIEYLASYKRKFSAEAQRFTDNAVHDDASDYADAIRYLVQLMDILAAGDGTGTGGTIDETVVNRDFYRAPRVLGVSSRKDSGY